jgi:serine/threonine protein phosphatase PrpC
MAENYFGITDKGKQRGNNEDTFIAQAAREGDNVIACVIDGVGGYEGGEVAAAIARETIIQRLDASVSNVPADLAEAFKIANERIYAEKQKVKQHQSMACVATLALADIGNNQFYYAHVGDTRLYLFRDRSLVKVSSDHSFVGFLEDSGRLTEEAAMNHPKRNEINKALGFEAEVVNEAGYIETGNSPFLPGDILLLCSDGLTDMVNSQEITAILGGDGSLDAKGKKLIDLANNNGGKDNITAVLVQNNKATVRQPSVRPVPDQKMQWKTVPKPAALKNKEKDSSSADKLPSKKSNRGWLFFLGFICIASLLANVYLLNQINTKPELIPVKDSLVKASAPVISQLQTQLQDTINKFSKKDTLFLKDDVIKSPLLLGQAININKDTLYIAAKGNLTLKRDSGYNGPAIVIGPACKFLVLKNLTIDGFATGIVANTTTLSLKHTKFINCQLSVQTAVITAKNQFISGKINGIVLKPDSLPKKITR